VQRIIRAYDDHKERTSNQLQLSLDSNAVPVKTKAGREHVPQIEQ
jgi:hypothetical protein